MPHDVSDGTIKAMVEVLTALTMKDNSSNAGAEALTPE
jgi:hypothetical protein